MSNQEQGAEASNTEKSEASSYQKYRVLGKAWDDDENPAVYEQMLNVLYDDGWTFDHLVETKRWAVFRS